MLYHILSYENSSLLKIDNIGFSSDPKICRFGPGKRELYLIHYVLKGEGYFNGNLLKKGQGFLITPQMSECYFPSENDTWKLLWVTSRDPNISELFNAYNANPLTNIFEYNYSSIADNLTDMIKKNHNKIYSATEILEIFLNLFNNQKKTVEPDTNVDMYYSYAVNYINTNIFRSIRVRDLTEFLGISQSYLYKIFKEKCGLSPQIKIKSLKILKAENMLNRGDMSITDISYSLGFATPQDFSKFFKKNTGQSPTNYKKTNFK